jgi:hypothetical protein
LFWDTASGIDPRAADARDRLFSGALALPNGLPKLFDAAGLIEVQRGSLTIRMNYENFDDYGQPLLGWAGSGRHLCHESGQRFALPHRRSGQARLLFGRARQ